LNDALPSGPISTIPAGQPVSGCWQLGWISATRSIFSKTLSAARWSTGAVSAVRRAAATTAPLALSHHGRGSTVSLSFNLSPGAALVMRWTRDGIGQAVRLPTSIVGLFAAMPPNFKSVAGQPGLILRRAGHHLHSAGDALRSEQYPITILYDAAFGGRRSDLALMMLGRICR